MADQRATSYSEFPDLEQPLCDGKDHTQKTSRSTITGRSMRRTQCSGARRLLYEILRLLSEHEPARAQVIHVLKVHWLYRGCEHTRINCSRQRLQGFVSYTHKAVCIQPWFWFSAHDTHWFLCAPPLPLRSISCSLLSSPLTITQR